MFRARVSRLTEIFLKLGVILIFLVFFIEYEIILHGHMDEDFYCFSSMKNWCSRCEHMARNRFTTDSWSAYKKNQKKAPLS
jgi:hypothetical protein